MIKKKLVELLNKIPDDDSVEVYFRYYDSDYDCKRRLNVSQVNFDVNNNIVYLEE